MSLSLLAFRGIYYKFQLYPRVVMHRQRGNESESERVLETGAYTGLPHADFEGDPVGFQGFYTFKELL